MLTLPPIGHRSVAAFEAGYVAACLLLFAYGVLEWRGIIGDRHPWRPISFIALSGAMLLQAVAPFVRRRSVAASYVLLGASLVSLGFSLIAS